MERLDIKTRDGKGTLSRLAAYFLRLGCCGARQKCSRDVMRVVDIVRGGAERCGGTKKGCGDPISDRVPHTDGAHSFLGHRAGTLMPMAKQYMHTNFLVLRHNAGREVVNTTLNME